MLLADTVIEIGNNLTTVVIAFFSLLGTLVTGLTIRHRVLKKRRASDPPSEGDISNPDVDITADDRPSKKQKSEI